MMDPSAARTQFGEVDPWGSYRMDSHRCATWHLGPLRLWAMRRDTDWQLASTWSGGHAETHVELRVNLPLDGPDSEPPAGATLERFGFEASPPHMALRPVLGDRAFLIRPETPFSLMPGQRARLFVTTPLWCAVHIAEKLDASPAAYEAAIYRAPDTWFGPLTSEGELCYASRTRGRLTLEYIERLSMRAISAVVVENRASDALRIERIRLPVPNMSLYRAKDGLFWTEELTLTRLSRGDTAELEMRKQPPPEAIGATFFREPRREAARHGLVRAFQWLGI